MIDLHRMPKPPQTELPDDLRLPAGPPTWERSTAEAVARLLDGLETYLLDELPHLYSEVQRDRSHQLLAEIRAAKAALP